MADVSPGMKVCDPACGVGKFLLELILNDLDRFYRIDTTTDGKEILIPLITLLGFDKGFDKDEQKTIILAKANMLIYLSGMIKDHPGITTQFAQLFNNTFLLQTNSILGTLAKPITDEYDLILTNPPYVMSGSSNLKEEIAKDEELKAHYSINAMGIEGLFMEWIVRALKPGGKAFVVVPDGIMNRSNDKKLRDFILEECIVDAIISLPVNTFFTTNKKTYILAITKKTPLKVSGIDSLERQKSPVFTYLCSEIGESRDVYRFNIDQNDLEVASTLFNMFKGAKLKFKSSDRRCKIIDIEALYTNSHWSVDRWWTREERIELGIEEEQSVVDINTYISMINDTSQLLTESIEPLQELIKKQLASTDRRQVSLSDTSLFTLSLGKRVLKKDYITSKGDIPVFSANVFEPFVYSEHSNIKEFDKDYVLWGIDGTFTFNVMKKGQPFASTDHCGTIKILNEDIDPYYLAYMMEETRHKYGFDRGLRASLTNMKLFKIDIPIKNDGTFDIDVQRSIAESLLCLKQTRTMIREKMGQLVDQKIEV